MIRISLHRQTGQNICCAVAWLMILWLIGAVLPRPTGAVADAEVFRLQETIHALHRVYEQAEQDLQEQKNTNRLSSREQSEYGTFIRYIGGRIALYCRQLYTLGGMESLEGLTCPAGGSGDGQAAASTAEEIAALDASLAESLGAFDEMLLTEEQKVAARQPRRSAAGAGQGGQGGQAGTGVDSGLQGSFEESSQDAQGQDGEADQEVSASTSPAGQAGSGRGGGGIWTTRDGRAGQPGQADHRR